MRVVMARVMFVLGAVLVGGGCHPDYEVQLPHGYRVLRTNSKTTILHKGNQTVVAAKIVGIQVERGFILGEVVPSPESEVWQEERVGFFVVNMLTGVVEAGMTREAFEGRVVAAGIKVEHVNLRPPWELPYPRI